MKRRFLIPMFIFMLALTTAIGSIPLKAVADTATEVTIHYKPAENNELEWNLWIWPEGGEGKAYPFTGTDEFGQVATVELEGDHQRVGFIVRTDDWQKDVDADRFVEVLGGEGEVWLISGDATVYSELPGGPKKEVNHEQIEVTVHYHRFDENYEGWNLWLWPDQKDGAAYTFTGEDEFGKIAKFTVPNTAGVSQLGFIVRHSTSDNEWNNREFSDRFIQKINDDGTAEIWLVQGQERVFYDLERASNDLHPRILSANIDEIDTISVETNIAFQPSGSGAEGFTVKTGDASIPIKGVQALEVDDSGHTRKAIIELAESINLNNKYSVAKEGYTAVEATMGDIFGSQSFEDAFFYQGDDLGAIYSKDETKLRVWAPTAEEAKVVVYETWDATSGEEIEMQKAEKGTWTAALSGDRNGTIYTYKVNIGGTWNEAVDPYARAVTVNGDKGVIVDLSTTNPEGWSSDEKPELMNPTDAIIYELHVRDLSIHPESGIKNKGKFLGLTETGTTGPNGTKTGLDHIKDLGVTHVQLLPIYDYNTVDETRLDEPQFNWGYDPKNYNAVEGSYSTDPYNPTVRINELKQTVKALHDNDLRIIMDVVYNHMYAADPSNLGKLVPGYYYRYTENGQLANGTGVGNDTASERAMMRKLIVDSVKYWATEYRLDGFRFDLMGIHDVDTMNLVRQELDKIDPSIIVIGEGWVLGTPLPEDVKANQTNARKMPGIAHFNDYTRDGLKGSVFESESPGWVNGDLDKFNVAKGGAIGGFKWNSLIGHFADEPTQSVNYVEAHDNNTLWDKLEFTNPNASEEDRIKMHKLATTFVLTSQGIPFLHAGQEFLRTKGGDHNSYKSPDSVNQLDWERKAQYQDVVDYYKGVIELRKAHPAFRMTTKQDIRDHVTFLETDKGVIAYTINGYANGDAWDTIAVVHNAFEEAQQVKLPVSGTWNIVANGVKAGTETIETVEGDTVTVPALASLVLYTGEVQASTETGSDQDTNTSKENNGQALWLTITIIVTVLIVAGAAWYMLQRRKKK